jgi:phospholipid/cholesterol/gamma-HCH transport system substrate-binding protein
MKFRIRFANQLVGVFVLAAFAFLLFILASMGINQHWFEKRHMFRSDFPSARGITAGMNITYKGFAIGKVTDIRLTRQNQVSVRFFIRDEYYPRVYRYSALQLTSNPLGLGGGLNFIPGAAPTEPLPDGSLIPSWDTPEAKQWQHAGLLKPSSEEDAIGNILSQAGPLIAKINEVLDSAHSILATVDGSLKGSDNGPLGQALARANSLVGGVNRTVTSLNDTTLTNLDGVLANLNEMSANLAILSRELQSAKGLVPKLLDAKGSIATFLDDNNRLFDRIDSIVASLQTTAADVKKLADYLDNTTPQLSNLLEEGQKTLSTTQDVLQGVKNNPLIRGGIPERIPQPTTSGSIRDAQF